MIGNNSARRHRQMRILRVVGVGLIAAGAVVLIFLQRMPLPMRILVGLTDIFAGLILVVVAWQQSSRDSSEKSRRPPS
jgi:uncharacterized membrane protein HdeD (DUF308 family)